jgi:hypothetical protein
VPGNPRQRMGESSARRRAALLKKEPAIGDGSQSREKRQGKSIRGSVVCRNSHTERKTLLAHEAFRNRAARALKRGGPGNDALRVELRRSSSPNVGMRGAELKLPGFKDPATEMPTPPERSYSARAALCC